MACNDRQLSQAQREAAYQQQRTGVVQAVRPFSGSATIENLIDYINRELGPAVRQSRKALNDIFLQVADQAPSANPLSYYFATSVAGGDPTVGRIKLDAATQNTATVLRVSESNARLQSVQPWLDAMSGGVTAPIGVVTLVDAINPGRFLRFDLNTMTDQGAYWDLGVTIVESSDANPFVEDEAVVVSFIPGVAAAGATVPVGSLSPVANDTFLGNVSGGVAAPSAVNLSTLAGAGLAFAAHTLDVTGSTSITVTGDQVQRAAITGAVALAANANTSLFAGIRDNGSAETDRTNLNFLSGPSITMAVTDDSGNDELEIKATYSGSTSNVNSATTAGDLNVFDISALECGGIVTLQSLTEANIDGFTAKTDGFWFVLQVRDTTTSDYVTLIENSGNTTTSIRTPAIRDWRLSKNDAVMLFYSNSRWRVVDSREKLFITDQDSVTWASQQDDYERDSRGTAGLRITLTGSQTLTGVVPDGVTPNGEIISIENVDSVDTLTIAHDATSTAANRFFLPGSANLALGPRTGGLFRYDATSSRWRLLGQGPVLLTGEVTSTSAGVATVTRSTDYASSPWSGAHTFGAAVAIGARFAYTGTITPSAISADQDNYSPTGWGTSNVVRLSTNSGTERTLTGATAGTSGEFKWLVNLGPGNIRLDASSTASTAANRFLTTSGTTYTIVLNGAVGILYDGTSSRWRALAERAA